MHKAKVAVTHPGKIGDALYSLPFIRDLAEQVGAVDFYTSEYCNPLIPFFQYQSCINSAQVANGYRVERMDIGAQPWSMASYIPDTYDAVYECGFRQVPHCALHQFIALQHGVFKPLAVEYEFPKTMNPPEEPYIVLAARGETSWKETFLRLIELSPVPVYLIGGAGDFIGNSLAEYDKTGLSLLETCEWISKSRGFVGLGSAMLVLANGFPHVRKVVPHHGYEYDYRHFIYTAANYYLQNPSAEHILETLAL